LFRALLQPGGVIPGVVINIGDDRGCIRAYFLLIAVGIGFFVNVAVLVFNFVFINLADA
jgi:hypothetical protein